MSNQDKPTSAIQVIDRAVHMLDALSQYDQAVSLKYLAADTGLHPSTAFRILGSLIAHKIVEKNETGDYQLGTRLLSWGDKVRSRMDVRTEARPIMKWLRDEIGETVNLTTREGDEVVYIERVISQHAIRVEQVIGSRAPLHVTAVGKLMLGESGEHACHEYANRTGLPKFTRNTLTDESKLAEEIQQAIQNGYALDNEEAEMGVGCIGVVIHDSSGAVVAGLSVSAPIERRRPEWVQFITKAGNQLSERLGYNN